MVTTTLSFIWKSVGRHNRQYPCIRAATVLAIVLPLPMALACGPREDCHTEFTYRTFDLSEWCAESSQCSYMGETTTCPSQTEEECRPICEGSSSHESCMTWCMSNPSHFECPFMYAPIGGDMFWEFPVETLISQLGYRYFFMSLSAGAPIDEVEAHATVDGTTDCMVQRSARSLSITCILSDDARSVLVDITGQHAAFSLSPLLRESSASKPIEVCEM